MTSSIILGLTTNLKKILNFRFYNTTNLKKTQIAKGTILRSFSIQVRLLYKNLVPHASIAKVTNLSQKYGTFIKSTKNQ